MTLVPTRICPREADAEDKAEAQDCPEERPAAVIADTKGLPPARAALARHCPEAGKARFIGLPAATGDA